MQAYQDTDVTLRINVLDDVGQPLQLTGMALKFSFVNGTKIIFAKEIGTGIEVASCPEGKVEVTLSAEDLSLPSGEYTVELLVTDPDGRRFLALQEKFELKTRFAKE